MDGSPSNLGDGDSALGSLGTKQAAREIIYVKLVVYRISCFWGAVKVL